MQSCAVIGCGPAGIVASTTLRQCGLMVTCFELGKDSGGMWRSNSRDLFSDRGLISPIYPSMRCALPKDLMSFSDKRFDYAVAQFPHHSAVQHYLEQFADMKGIRGMTRFNTKVESIRMDPKDKLWKIITVNVSNGDVMEWSFNKVCICTGQTHQARFPAGLKDTLHGYTRAGGEVHHSSHVKDFRSFKGKRVAVVGDGVSAYDYCLELQRCGAEVLHSSMLPPTRAATAASATVPGWFAGGAAPTSDEPASRNATVPSAPRRGGWWRGRRAERARSSAEELSAPDFVSTALGVLRRLPGWREDTHRANDVVRKWLRYRNERVAAIPRVGLPVDATERGLLFREDPTKSVAELVRDSVATRGAGATASASDGVFVDNVDAVICATGYTQRYPFLHPDLRHVVEGGQLHLTPTAESSAGPSSPKAIPEAEAEAASTRGLYLGTVYAAEPSLAFVGIQKELLPPFLLFEAQARFVAYSFSGRIVLPTTAAQMQAHERALLETNPPLKDLYREEGLGLHSAVYYNVLHQELQVSSKDTYTSQVMRRQYWLLLSTILRVYHRFRAMAPLKRKKQHILFSNKI